MRNIHNQTNRGKVVLQEPKLTFNQLNLAKQFNSSESILLPVSSDFDNKQRAPCQINDVLCCEYQDRFHFILPAYVKLSCQTITDIQLDIAVANVSSTLIITVYYGDLPRQFVEQLELALQIRVSNRCELYLKETQFVENLVSNLQLSRNEQNKTLKYIVRAMLPLEIRCDVFWTPFESLYLRMTVKMSAQNMNFLGKDAQVHFNIMYSGEQIQKSNQRKLQHSNWKDQVKDFFSCEQYTTEEGQIELDKMFDINQVSRFTQYGVSRSSRRFQTYKSNSDTNKKNVKGFRSRFRKCFGLTDKQTKQKEKNKQKQKQRWISQSNNQNSPQEVQQHVAAQHINKYSANMIQQIVNASSLMLQNQFQKIKQKLGIQWHPLTTLIELLIPAVFLALINLAIYFQEHILSARILSIATLLVAYTTFLPSVRQRIPPAPRLTLIEVLLYAIILSSALCLLRSFIDRDVSDQELYHWRSDPCFIISLTLLIFVFVVVLMGLLIRRIQTFIDSRHHHTISDDAEALERREWSNDDALAYYKSTDLLTKYKRYSNDFIQKQSIFERLWLYRFSNLMLHEGPQPDPQCDQQVPLVINLQQLHQSKMLPVVKQFYKTYMQFYVFINRILYISELSQRLQEVEGKLPKMNIFYRQRKQQLQQQIRKACCIHKIKGTNPKTTLVHRNPYAICYCGDSNCSNIVQRYRLARTQLILEYIKLQEHIQEDIEFKFQELSTKQQLINIAPQPNIFIKNQNHNNGYHQQLKHTYHNKHHQHHLHKH